MISLKEKGCELVQGKIIAAEMEKTNSYVFKI